MKTFNKRTFKRLTLIATVCISSSLTGCYSTVDRNADQYTAEDIENRVNGVECKMEKPVGSNILTRVCRTAQERADLQEESRATFFRMQNAGGASHADGE